MPGKPPFGDATLGLHAGHPPVPPQGGDPAPLPFSHGLPLTGPDQAAAAFNLQQAGHGDGRLGNPTLAALEERIATLEGGIGAIATASGAAALHLAIATLLDGGSHIVATDGLDWPARRLLAQVLPRFGITTRFVDGRDLDAWRDALVPETRLFVAPTLTDPGLAVLDIPAIAGIAHAAGLPLVVDSTLTTPALLKPLDLGADLVVHDAGPYLEGHGLVQGGLLVDGGRFDWLAGRPFPTLTHPWEGLSGSSFVDESPVAAFLLRARLEGLPAFGAALSPMNARQILLGLETLALRMTTHSAQARLLAEHLQAQPLVERVTYPGLPGHPHEARTRALLPAGAGAVVRIDLPGGLSSAQAFIQALRVFAFRLPGGGARSTLTHPASQPAIAASGSSHAEMEAGPGTLRLSVGLESPGDLLQDVERGLRAVAKHLQV